MRENEKKELRIKRKPVRVTFSNQIQNEKRINYLQRYGLIKQFRAIKKDICENKKKKEKWEKICNNQFAVAVVVKALFDAYHFNPAVYLYSLLIIQKLPHKEIPMTSVAIKETASAVFLVSIKIMGEGAEVPIENFIIHFGELEPDGILHEFNEMLSIVSGLPILKVFKEKNKDHAILEIEKSMKEFLSDRFSIFNEELSAAADDEKEWDNVSTLSWSKSF